MVNEWTNIFQSSRIFAFFSAPHNTFVVVIINNLNKKILSYGVKHFQTYVKFSYRALTSPHLSSVYITVIEFTSKILKSLCVKPSICNFSTLHITETKQSQILLDFKSLTKFFF